MVSQACYSTGEGRRYSARACAPYMSFPERRYHFSPHDGRTLGMPDSHLDRGEAQPQRKRISVACGRCRKRKIRCSGDPGGGQPCSNCKNAGSEPCLFLRVQSTEAPMRGDASDFPYNVQDARLYTNRAAPVPYSQDLPPAVAPAEMMGSYRGSPAYTYAPKQFCVGVPSYGGTYPEEYVDYSLNGQPQQLLHHDAVSMASYGWPSSRAKPPGSAAALYLESENAYPYGGGGAGANPGGGCRNSGSSSSSMTSAVSSTLVQRPAQPYGVLSEPGTNFSFSSMAAHLPAATAGGGGGSSINSSSSTGSSERLLPTPATRSLSGPGVAAAAMAGLAYSGSMATTAVKASVLPPGVSIMPHSTTASVSGGPPVEMAAAVAYHSSGSFDISGLPYASGPPPHHANSPHSSHTSGHGDFSRASSTVYQGSSGPSSVSSSSMGPTSSGAFHGELSGQGPAADASPHALCVEGSPGYSGFAGGSESDDVRRGSSSSQLSNASASSCISASSSSSATAIGPAAAQSASSLSGTCGAAAESAGTVAGDDSGTSTYLPAEQLELHAPVAARSGGGGGGGHRAQYHRLGNRRHRGHQQQQHHQQQQQLHGQTPHPHNIAAVAAAAAAVTGSTAGQTATTTTTPTYTSDSTDCSVSLVGPGPNSRSGHAQSRRATVGNRH